jgi:outer membrane protein assembly complex protein YaeT
MQLRETATSRFRDAVRGAMLLALLAAAPSVARGQDLACDLGDVEVRSLKFSGNKAISSEELALRVTTTPSSAVRRTLRVLGAKRCLNRDYLPLDLAKLELFYLDRGYYYAKADTVITRVGRNAVSVLFRIDEGPVTTLTSYRVDGLEGVRDSAAILRALRLRQGGPFDYSLFLADLDTITQRLRNSGYYRATTLPERVRDSLTASVTVTVEPGKRMQFGEPAIQVTPLGNRTQQVPDRVVRQVVGISPGTLFSDHAITEAQRSLYQLGIYRHVEVVPRPDSLQTQGDSVVSLDVRLSEDLTHALDTEYGLATLDCGRLRAQYTDLNFLHSARRLELTGQTSKLGYGEPVASARTRDLCTFNGQSPLAEDSAFSSQLHYYGGISLRQPRLLGTKWVPTLSVYSERRGEFKAYLRTTKVGANLSATRDIAERTQLRIGYSQELGRTVAQDALLCQLFSRCDDASRQDITREATLGVASATLTRLRTDNLVNPTRGSVMRLEFRTSGSRFLGTSPSLFFNKGSVEAAYYTPFGFNNVVSLRVRAGLVQNAPGSFIPPQERLYAGGPTSVRGFQQNELGDVVYLARPASVTKDSSVSPRIYHVVPVDSIDPVDRIVPLGGNRLFVANLEYRVPDRFLLPKYLQYTFFVDAGDVWTAGNSAATATKADIKYTPGFGLRLISPIGPVQMNFGYNSSQRNAGQMYFEDPQLATSAISPLYCVSPGNTIPLVLTNGVYQPPASATCDATYQPPRRGGFFRRLAITFSIGSEF